MDLSDGSGKRMWHLDSAVLLRNVMIVLIQLAILYVLFSPLVAMPLYNKMLFYPDKVGSYNFGSAGGLKTEDVYFKSSNGKQLHGWYFPVPGSKFTVLISHGNAGNISHRLQIIAMFLKAKVSVLAYDYQGYGLSQGEPSIKGILEDGEAAYDYLVKSKGVSPESIVLFGESLGGAVAARLAKEKPSAALVLQSSFSSLQHVAVMRMPFLNIYPAFLYPDILDTAAVVRNYKKPLLIGHGVADRTIPISEAELVCAAACGPKTIVRLKRAGHNDIYDVEFPEYYKAVSKFLASLTVPPVSVAGKAR